MAKLVDTYGNGKLEPIYWGHAVINETTQQGLKFNCTSINACMLSILRK